MKKGMSDVVTTVLILLFAIVAVAIIGGIVMNQISKTGTKIASSAICSELEVEPVRCSNDISTGAYVVVQRGSGGADIKLSNVAALFEKADGTIDTAYIDDVSTFKPLSSAKLFSHSIIDNVKKVGLDVEITDADGSKSSCNYYKTIKEDCFKGDEIPLLGYWPFDIAGDYKDYSGHGYDLTTTNAPASETISGTGNGYLSFDGTGKSLTNNAFIWLEDYKQVTVSFWSNIPSGVSLSKCYPIFGVGPNSHASNYFNGRVHCHDENAIFWDYGDPKSSGRGIASSGYVDRWIHVTLVSNGVNSKKIYINGDAMTLTTRTPDGTLSDRANKPTGVLTNELLDKIFIGKSEYETTGSPPPTTQLFKGNLNEFMIYNQVLTDAEVKRIYNLQKSKFGV